MSKDVEEVAELLIMCISGESIAGRASQCTGPRRAAYPVCLKNWKAAEVVKGECARGRME